jgi:NAD(P)-dependent dehydrogenase (short-subunit alcohol dehydrogenase family)
MELAGKVVLVTGASSGIGAALARELARRGATLGLAARRRERLEAVLADCRKSAPGSRLWAVDLSDPARGEALVAEAWRVFGHLDVLINNAAIPSRTKVWNLGNDELQNVMRTDFESPVRMSLAALRRMRERKSGLIVNVSSLGGRLGIPNESAYCAAKFALCGWSEAAAADLADEPVRVKLVLPGPIDTEIWDIATEEPADYDGPLIPASECAAQIADALERDGFEHYVPDMKQVVVGKSGNVDGFIAGSAAMARAAHAKRAAR